MLLTCFSPHVSICSVYKYTEKIKKYQLFKKKIYFFFFFIVCIKKKFKFAKVYKDKKFKFGMKRNYIDIKETLLKYDMYYIFCAISYVYGNESLNKFVSYVKEKYDLDLSYNPADIIEVMEKDELIMNISIFFDSEDKRHISEIGIKDPYLKNLILCLIRNVPYTYN